MTDNYSPMSINQLIHNEPHKDDVQLAAEALGNLSNATLSTPSSSPLPTPSSYISDVPRFSFSSSDTSSIMEDEYIAPPPPLPHLHQQQQPQTQQPLSYMNRVSNLPLVNSALRVYEKSSAQNVVKYGTDMVGSFAAPIYDKFGKGAPTATVNTNTTTTSSTTTTTTTTVDNHDEATMAAVNALARTSLTDDLDNDGVRRRNTRLDDENIRKTRSRPHSRSTSPHRPYIKSAPAPRHHHHHHHPLAHRTKVSKSRWQQIVMHAGSAAGTTVAVVSEESMKCLRYCLHWLQYATQHIQQQMNLLRSFLVSLATSSNNNSSKTKTVSRHDHQSSASTLAAIQKEIILTLRKVVEVVSRYAGVGLPTHAKASVRSFILQLPSRWATLNSSSNSSSSDISNPSTATPSSLDNPSDGVPDHVKETSIKLLNFGGESVEMLESVSTVFSDSIDRAEVWLDRLRVVGVSPGHTHAPSSSSSISSPPPLASFSQAETTRMQVDCMET